MTTDPRAEFAAIEDDELRADLQELAHRANLIRQGLAARPSRQMAEERIDALQRRSAQRVADRAGRALGAMNPPPGSPGFNEARDVAFYYVFSTDGFAAAMKEGYAAKLPTEADLAPKREELGWLEQRHKAIRAELDLRKLDELRAVEESKREAALEAMSAAD